jgi:hypothetical protein
MDVQDHQSDPERCSIREQSSSIATNIRERLLSCELPVSTAYVYPPCWLHGLFCWLRYLPFYNYLVFPVVATAIMFPFLFVLKEPRIA